MYLFCTGYHEQYFEEPHNNETQVRKIMSKAKSHFKLNAKLFATQYASYLAVKYHDKPQALLAECKRFESMKSMSERSVVVIEAQTLVDGAEAEFKTALPGSLDEESGSPSEGYD